MGTAGAGAERFGNVNRGAGRTGISLGTAGLGAGLDCGFGLGFAAGFGLLVAGVLGVAIGAGAVCSEVADAGSEELTCPACVGGAVGGASVLGVMTGSG